MARREFDAYLTPLGATQALIAEFPEISGDRLLDPCSGDGRMSQALAPRFESVICNDLDRRRTEARYHMDARNRELYAEARPDWIVTNPPFLHAAEIAWTALKHARQGVALLLRCTFLEPCGNRRWLESVPPAAILALSRISFTGDGQTDSAGSWWFVWGRSVRPRIVVRPKGGNPNQGTLFPEVGAP